VSRVSAERRTEGRAARLAPLERLKPARGVEHPIPEAGPSEAVRDRDSVYRRFLAAADVLAATVALLVGVIALGTDDGLTPALLAAIPLVLLVSKVIGLYDRDQDLMAKHTLDEAPALFQVSTLYTLAIWLAQDLVVTGEGMGGQLGNDQVLGIWALLFVSMLASRTVARALALRISPAERCLVLGDAQAASHVKKKFAASGSLKAEIVGRVVLAEDEDASNGVPVLGHMERLGLILGRYDVHRVIIAPRSADSEELLDAIRLTKSMGVKVSVLPRLFEVVGSSVRFDDVEGLTLLGLPSYGLSQSSKFLKRGMDMSCSALMLIGLVPLFAAVAIAIKLTSRGPVFFRQARIGRGGVEFQMLKFRTMVDGADEHKAELLHLNEADGLFKIANDPRITSVGVVLRRFSIDELPQLLNVLKGEMSLVGPRPLVADDDARVEGLHRRRLDLSPGMTGVWQVLGSSRIPLQEMVKIDYLYGANWSLWQDVKILLRTVPYVMARRGL